MMSTNSSVRWPTTQSRWTLRSIRWYFNKLTGLATIRRHPDAQDYPPPDTVKRMMSGQEVCPTCGQLLPNGNGENHD